MQRYTVGPLSNPSVLTLGLDSAAGAVGLDAGKADCAGLLACIAAGKAAIGAAFCKTIYKTPPTMATAATNAGSQMNLSEGSLS